MTAMALLVAAVVALIGTWRDAVAVILLAMVGVPLRVIGPYVRISAVALSVQCAACKRLGHEASSCDMLAIALFLDKYKKNLTDDSRRTIKST
jgi:hypothetical protein